MSLNHYTNKSTYQPAAVIAAVDKSFASNADDALLTYSAVDPAFADFSFLGRSRNNVTAFRQTQFVVNLMNGTDFGAVDPRMSRILAPSSDGQFRGVDINVAGFGAMSATQQPFNFFGYAGTGGVGLPARYIFDDRSKIPFMTYAQLQFVKAEAAYRLGEKPPRSPRIETNFHIDFVNSRNLDANQAATQITRAESGFPRRYPHRAGQPSALTLTQIMSQKYIAQAWATTSVDGHAGTTTRTMIRSPEPRCTRGSRRRRICSPTTTARSRSAFGRVSTRSTCGTLRR
jgi:hypothetical protein